MRNDKKLFYRKKNSLINKVISRINEYFYILKKSKSMKKLFLVVIAFICFLPTFSQETNKKEKEELTIEVKHNGISHTISVGDTIHLGYGSNPDGSFMYIGNGAPRMNMGKEFASKSGTVTKIKYWKSIDQYQLYIKGKFGLYLVDIPQAIDKDEVIGFNQTYFEPKN